MSEMIERVAIALTESLPKSLIVEDDLRSAARAVIEAMREPTAEIISAGSDYMPGAGYAEGAWRAMIDAASKEK